MTDRTIRILVVVDIAWSAALIPAALLLPIANPQSSGHHRISLTQNNGPGILWIPIVTLVLALIVAFLLGRQGRTDGLGPSRLATGVGVIVLLGAIVGTVTFLVGVFLVPTAVLILLASGDARHNARSKTSLEGHTESGPPCDCGRKNDLAARYCTSCGELLIGSDRSAT